MGVLDLEGPEDSALPSHSARKRSNLKKGLIGAGGIAAVAGIGSTLAANINLNNSAPVEFGQGVTQTVACDEDGFTITPVSYFDNANSSYRLDYVQVSGLNLIPQGADSATYDSNHGGSPYVAGYSLYGTPSDRAAHPGQYYDSVASTWKKTCDGVVLDFKAYTDDSQYSKNTVDGYQQYGNNPSQQPNTISTPLLWNVYGPGGGVVTMGTWGINGADNADIAVIFGSTNNQTTQTSGGSYWEVNDKYSNVATITPTSQAVSDQASIDLSSPADSGGTWFVKESSFQFYPANGHHIHALHPNDTWRGSTNYDPSASAISKITVESMNFFPDGSSIRFSNGYGVKP